MAINAQVLEASVDFSEQPFVKPLRLSSGVITRITQATATVRVRVNGMEATGRGAIYLSDLWAWPDAAMTHEMKDAALRAFCRAIASDIRAMTEHREAHPLVLGLVLHDHAHLAAARCSPAIPDLAAAMALSPFDAAIHDAVGRALGCPALAIYSEPFSCEASDNYFSGRSTQKAIARVLLPKRRTALDAWLIVGKDDELPQSLSSWVKDRGYRCFKLKTMGKNAADDAQRTVAVFEAARALGIEKPRLSVDSNEANPDADSVLEYLERLRSASPAAFDALQYLEQPTGRDIRKHAFDWGRVSANKPVMLDEGLTSLSLLSEAQTQRWSGLALKTCKGHSFALVAAAWAHERNMLLSMQDLTNPGIALIHSAILASRLPTINGVELNSPQFTPDANAAWMSRQPELFSPSNGQHQMTQEPIGLGTVE